MASTTYTATRARLETYFDRTAVEAWKRLTSDAPVGSIRATVRAGREAMRGTLLGWLPADLAGRTLLDAGCGTGALSVAAAQRGAAVVAVDLSPTLVTLADERANPSSHGHARIDWRVGDMLDPAHGEFDHVVAMDSLIHYRTPDVVAALAGLAPRVRQSMLVTFAPRTPALAAMHLVGKAFPRGNRSPAIVPVGERDLLARIDAEPALKTFRVGRTHRVAAGFYISQALELVRR
jgi:magnesium-protoporphyrin O-methyltransferase